MQIIDEKFWLAIAFTAFAVLIYRLVWPNMSKAIAGKSEQIAKDLNDAKDAKEKAEALLIQVQEQYEKATQDAEKILIDAKDEAKKFIEDSKGSIEGEIKRKVEALDNRIKGEEDRAIRDIKAKIVTVSLQNVKDSLEKVDKDKFENVVKKSVDDISKIIH